MCPLKKCHALSKKFLLLSIFYPQWESLNLTIFPMGIFLYAVDAGHLHAERVSFIGGEWGGGAR